MADKQVDTISYANLSRYPLNQRERILQDWLAQYAWELLGSEVK